MSRIDLAQPASFPEDADPRLSHLEETSAFALNALDQAAALSDFSMSLVKMEGPEPILELCLARVDKLLNFSSMGMMLVNEEDSSFYMARSEPPEAAGALDALARECVDNGTFAFALREKRAVFAPAAPGKARRLLHVVTTASRTRGMFLAEFDCPPPCLSDVALSILTIILNNTAQALESHYLHARIKEMNRALEDKVKRLAGSEAELRRTRDAQERLITEKTSALQSAKDNLETEVRQRRKAEVLLESLNQRLEAKVEVRTKALFRKVAEMEEANKQLKELERLKTAFLSSVSHELRTPLTSILGFAKLIARDFDKYFHPDAQNQHYGKAERLLRNLAIVEKESERLTRLINDVLDLSRIESGKMPWRDEPVVMADVIREAAMAVEGRLENRPGIELKFDLSPDLPEVLADRDRVLQVLINLLDNALKFTEAGHVRVAACLAGSREAVEVRVEDTGPGISPEESEKIFDKFHQHGRKDTLKNKPKGTGLGLAICRHIVNRHGGRIWMEPSPGKGCAFIFTLPLKRPGRGRGGK